MQRVFALRERSAAAEARFVFSLLLLDPAPDEIDDVLARRFPGARPADVVRRVLATLPADDRALFEAIA
jgi:hypothetical protein